MTIVKDCNFLADDDKKTCTYFGESNLCICDYSSCKNVCLIYDSTDKTGYSHVTLYLLGTTLQIEQKEQGNNEIKTRYVTELELPTKTDSEGLFILFSTMEYDKFYLDSYPQ